MHAANASCRQNDAYMHEFALTAKYVQLNYRETLTYSRAGLIKDVTLYSQETPVLTYNRKTVFSINMHNFAAQNLLLSDIITHSTHNIITHST